MREQDDGTMEKGRRSRPRFGKRLINGAEYRHMVWPR